MAAPRKTTATKPKAPAHPGDPCDSPRLESYPAVRPEGEPVTVIRCQECGAHDVK